MKLARMAAAATLATAALFPTVVAPAYATDGSAPPSANARGMSPNRAESAFTVNWNNAQIAYDFFIKRGLTKRQSAGIVGNLIVESGVSPIIAQVGGGPGRGIAQWSVGGRWDTYAKDNVVWYAGTRGMSRWSLSLQLNFVWYELNTFRYYGLSALQATTTIDAATVAFMRDYEGCGVCHTDRRKSYAQQVFTRFG